MKFRLASTVMNMICSNLTGREGSKPLKHAVEIIDLRYHILLNPLGPDRLPLQDLSSEQGCFCVVDWTRSSSFRDTPGSDDSDLSAVNLEKKKNDDAMI